MADNHMAPTDKRRLSALVTGASSGIGTAFAEHLARDGYDLIVVGRRRERLEDLAWRLREGHGIDVEVLVADLAKPIDLRSVEKRIKATENLEILVNNAGFDSGDKLFTSFIDQAPDLVEEIIQLQVVAPVRLTHAALRGMVARDCGTIIGVATALVFSASEPASTPLPKRVLQVSTKEYLKTFTQVLHSELEGTGVRLQVLCPGVVDSGFHSQAALARYAAAGVQVATPAAVVEASFAGLRLGEVICVPTLDDPALIAQYQESARRLFQRSRTAAVSARYTTR